MPQCQSASITGWWVAGHSSVLEASSKGKRLYCLSLPGGLIGNKGSTRPPFGRVFFGACRNPAEDLSEPFCAMCGTRRPWPEFDLNYRGEAATKAVVSTLFDFIRSLKYHKIPVFSYRNNGILIPYFLDRKEDLMIEVQNMTQKIRMDGCQRQYKHVGGRRGACRTARPTERGNRRLSSQSADYCALNGKITMAAMKTTPRSQAPAGVCTGISRHSTRC